MPPPELPPLPVGKLPAERLVRLLSRIPRTDPQVIVGPRLGEDAAVIEMGERCLVVTTDPITFATERIGWYAVHVNANDVAVLGARPRWFFATLLLPERGTTDVVVDRVMSDIVEACGTMGVTVCGGHTEITAGLSRPVVIGQMLGEVARERLVRKERLRPGDVVLMTHGAAIEGTAILATEQAERLRTRVPAKVIERAECLRYDPGLSVVAAAMAAVEVAEVHAMHDPTEGGVLTGLAEIASAAGAGLRVEAERIPILPETRAVCAALGLDPLGLLASGALLIGVAPAEADAVTSALAARGIPAVRVARVVPREDGLVIAEGGRTRPLTAPARDEIARLFER